MIGIINKTLDWVKLNRLEFFLLFSVLLLASFLRFYRLSEYMTFLGDEGRDALIVQRVLTTFDLPLIGPPTSVGNMYLGPAYYYMMSVPMAIFWLNPIAAAGMVALIGVGTVFLIYYLGKLWYGAFAGIIASFLYAVSPVTIIYSRSSWNPNPAPFFTLIAFLALTKARLSRDFRWFGLVGVALALAAQMHYLTLILIPIFGLLWLIQLGIITKIKKRFKGKNFWQGTILAIVGFLIVMSPLFVFDIKHNFVNYKAMSNFLLDKTDDSVDVNPADAFSRVVPIYRNNLIGRYMVAENFVLINIISLLLLIPVVVVLWLQIEKTFCWTGYAVAAWLFGGIFGTALYSNNIYDHYLGFLAPALYLLLGVTFDVLKFNRFKLYSKWITGAIIIFVLVLAFVNLQKNPLLSPPNKQLQRTEEISKFIIAKSNNQPFNFALIAERNYDAAYQFILGRLGYKPKMIPFEITNQLFVVCEDKICQPIGHSKYEIAGFGMAKIADEYSVMGFKVFKLVPNPSGK